MFPASTKESGIKVADSIIGTEMLCYHGTQAEILPFATYNIKIANVSSFIQESDINVADSITGTEILCIYNGINKI
jgi:hypothetical protein